MDAFALYAFGFSGIAWGIAGYIVGRVQREIRYRRDAAANLARAVARTNERRNARAVAVRVSDSGSNSDGDSDGDTGTGPRIAETGRRTIYGDNDRVRTGPAAARGARRRSNEAALVLSGHDC